MQALIYSASCSFVYCNSLFFNSYICKYFSVSYLIAYFWSSSIDLFIDINSLVASVLNTFNICSSLILNYSVSSSIIYGAWLRTLLTFFLTSSLFGKEFSNSLKLNTFIPRICNIFARCCFWFSFCWTWNLLNFRLFPFLTYFTKVTQIVKVIHKAHSNLNNNNN